MSFSLEIHHYSSYFIIQNVWVIIIIVLNCLKLAVYTGLGHSLWQFMTSCHKQVSDCLKPNPDTGIIKLRMRLANERRRYNVTSLLGWAHTQNDSSFITWKLCFEMFVFCFNNFNPSDAENIIFQENSVNAIAADALALCFTRSSAAISLTSTVKSLI